MASTNKSKNLHECYQAFEKVPDLYLILSPQLVIITASDAYLKATLTVREQIRGRGVFEVFPDNPATPDANSVKNLEASLQLVLKSRKPHAMAVQRYDVPEGSGFRKKYWSPVNTPVLDEQGEVVCIIHKVTDVTEQVQAAEELRKTEESLAEETRRFKDAQSTGKIGCFERELDSDRVIWSDELYRIHEMEPQSEEITLARFFAFISPEYREETKLAVARVRATGEPADLVQEIVTANGERKWVHRRAQLLRSEDGKPLKIYGTVQDITAQKKAEQQAQKGENLLESVVENTDSSIVAFEPVRNGQGEIIDFRYLFSNPKAHKSVGGRPLSGKRLSEEFPEVLRSGLLQQYKKIVETGEDWGQELAFELDGAKVWLQLYARKMNGLLLVTYFDITERKKNEEELRQSKELLEAATNTSPQAMVVVKSVRNAENQIVDFEYQWLNRVSEQLAGQGLAGKKMLELYPHVREIGLFDAYVNGIENNKMVDFEEQYTPGRWFRWQGMKLDDGMFISVEEITARKRSEKALEESRDLLQTIFESSPNSIFVYRIHYDDQRLPVDLELLTSNSAGLKRAGLSRKIAGQGAMPLPIKDKLFEVANSGVSADFEEFFEIEQAQECFRFIGVKTGDLLVLTAEDVTERRRTQQELLEAKDQLAQKVTDKYLTLFNAMDQGFCIQELLFDEEGKVYDQKYLEVNPAFERQTGMKNVQGKTVRQLLPDVEESWIEIQAEVLRTGIPLRYERHSAPLGKWFDACSFRVGSPETHQVAALFTDITERKKAEETLRESEEKFRTLFQTMREGFMVAEMVRDEQGKAVDYRFLELNKAFESIAGILVKDSIGHTAREMYPELKDWGLDIYAEMLQSGEQRRFEQYFEEYDKHYSMLAFPLGGDRFGVLYDEITERKKAEQQLKEFNASLELQVAERTRQLQESKEFIEAIMQSVPDFIAIHDVATGRMIYFNHNRAWDASFASEEFKDLDTQERAKRVVYPEDQARFFEFMKKREQLPGDEVLEVEFRARINTGDWGWMRCISKVLRRRPDGSAEQLVSVTSNISALKEAELKVREQNSFITGITETMPDMISVIELPSRRMVYVNREPFILHGFNAEDLDRMSPRERRELIHPDYWEAVQNYFEGFSKLENDKVALVEYQAKNKSGEWLWFRARGRVFERDAQGNVKSCVNVVQNITPQKQALLQIKQSQELLQSVFDSTLNFITVFSAERDKNGKIVDFRYRACNALAQKQEGQNPVGKRYSELHPGIQQTELFQRYATVVDLGLSQDFELHQGEEAGDSWLRIKAVKLGEGLVSAGEDVTASKKAEAETKMNLAILNQSEEVAGIGSWEYDLQTRRMRWSEGMYRLFNLEKDADIFPERYRQFVVSRDRAKTEQIIRNITEQHVPFQTEITILLNGNKKHIQVRAIPHFDKEGLAAKMLGIDMDVTERRESEAKLRKADQLKQKEVLNAVMQTQEEERRRIAEALHNEFGQLLTVTKLKLPRGSQEAESLLNSAITLVRSISHELMPSLLHDFGLETALQDLFENKLSANGIHFSSQIAGLQNRLSQMDEIAVFRIIQEIMNNIVKHSEATSVDIRIDRKDHVLSINIADNGIGLKKETARQGFGLRYISNRVELLKGKLTLVSEPPSGTQFQIEIPLTA